MTTKQKMRIKNYYQRIFLRNFITFPNFQDQPRKFPNDYLISCVDYEEQNCVTSDSLIWHEKQRATQTGTRTLFEHER